MAVNQQKPLTQSELIVQSWNQLGAESAGASELKTIGRALQERFGTGAIGPAAIARVLADEGVPLRHPEILECDACWRDEQLVSVLPRAIDTIDDAVVLMGQISGLTLSPEPHNFKHLRPAAVSLQQEFETIARSPTATDKTRAVASEVAEWLRIWLQNPTIFEDWLALRRNSPEFLQKFSS